MAKIPPLTALRVEDFGAEQRSWLPRLFTPLNSFLTAASNVINGRIEFGSNIPSQDAVLSFTYNGSAQRFQWISQILMPKVLIIGYGFEASVPIALLPVWQYDASTQTVSVNFVKASGASLTVGTQYQVLVRVLP